MTPILHHIDLKPLHTFGINAYAESFFQFCEDAELIELISSGMMKHSQPLILGGGSNFLPVGDVKYLVIHPIKKGIQVVNETDDHVWIEAHAGEVWDDFVAWSVDNGYYGLENLSLIPGHVGASPVQNVGAYGIEAGDCIDEVYAIDLTSGQLLHFSKNECQFGYRNSIFKSDTYKNRVVITRVIYKLLKKPVFHLDYGNIRDELGQGGEISLKSIRDAIIHIRTSKLPDPQVIGNAGSFFKNPAVKLSHAQKLKEEYPSIPWYPIDEEYVKLPAGWLIDKAGWKGKVMGQAGVHPLQALVLTNLGDARGEEIIALANAIENDVMAKFQVRLEKEVNVIE